MEIGRIFGKKSNEQVANLNGKQPNEVSNDENSLVKQIEVENIQSSNANGEDLISISSLSRQLSQISKIVDEDQAGRADKVAKIKNAIANGTYNVSSKDVAQSLINFSLE